MSLTHALLSTLVAFGSHWPIIDLPYPDVGGSGGASEVVTVEAEIERALLRHARLREPRSAPARKAEISQLRIEGPRASALLTQGERAERFQLQRIDGEWRVLNK
jgi:hypothetical protein